MKTKCQECGQVFFMKYYNQILCGQKCRKVRQLRQSLNHQKTEKFKKTRLRYLRSEKGKAAVKRKQIKEALKNNRYKALPRNPGTIMCIECGSMFSRIDARSEVNYFPRVNNLGVCSDCYDY